MVDDDGLVIRHAIISIAYNGYTQRRTANSHQYVCTSLNIHDYSLQFILRRLQRKQPWFRPLTSPALRQITVQLTFLYQ